MQEAVDEHEWVTSGEYDRPAELDQLSTVDVDFESYLAHRLSDAEKAEFASRGYLIVRDVLPREQHARLKELILELREQKIAEGWHAEEDLVQAVFSPMNDLQLDPAVRELLTQPKVFPKVVDILGANIFLYHSYLFATRPAPAGTPLPADYDGVATFGFHQDSGVQRDIRGQQPWISSDQSHPIAPRMSLKAAFYLTDCSTPGCGNTWVVPGSHNEADPSSALPASRRGQPPGAIPVLAPENSVMIFDRRLLHAQSPNWSQAERLVVFMGYGHRWLKARDAMHVEPAFQLTRCPIARQLLGYTTQNSGLYHGNGLDVPLRAWLRSNDCNRGLGFQLALADADGRGTGHQPMSALDGEVGHATFPRNPERLSWPIGELDAAKREVNDAQIYSDIHLDDCEVDPALYAANRLTPEQRKQFDEQALPQDLFNECKRLLLEMAADEVTRGAHAATGTDRGGFAAVTAACFSQANDLQRTALAKLLTTERIFPKVVDIMGTNTTCYHFHCNVTSAMGGTVLDEGDDSDGGAPAHPDFDTEPCFGFHQDSGLQADCEYRPAPRFSMKAGYFFTDVPLGAANTWIVPGGHLLEDELERPEHGQPKGAIPIVCKANSCLLFDRRLYHAATPNWGSRTRVACFVGYSWRWLRPKEPMYVERAMETTSCPIMRQMLGYTTSCGGNYAPNAEDTPLVAWLKKHQIGEWSDVPLQAGWRTQRELQGQGHCEGDVGHTTASRPGQPLVTLAGRFRAPKL